MGMAIDVKSRRPVIGNIQGGLSGPAIKPIALLKVHQVYEVARKHNVPIIGQGGITTGERCAGVHDRGRHDGGPGDCAFLRSASCRKINAGVADYLELNNLRGLTERRLAAAHGLTGRSVRTQRAETSILCPDARPYSAR